MTSIGFRVLDAHVVAGRADDPALVDAQGTLTYAQLLHEVASVAGALRQLGVQAGDAVTIDVRGRVEVLLRLALVRLEAVAADGGAVWVGADPVVVRALDQQFAWDTVLGAGRTDPLGAARHDTGDYADRALADHGDLLAPLLAGEPIRL